MKNSSIPTPSAPKEKELKPKKAIIEEQSDATEKEKISLEDTEREHARTRDAVRDECLRKLRSAMSSTHAITGKDYDIWEQGGISEKSLEEGGLRTHEQKLNALYENLQKYIPEMIADAKNLESAFFTEIAKAESKGWIAAESAHKWKDRLADASVIWYEKKTFLTKKFPHYLRNWQTLHEERVAALDSQKKLKIPSDALPELKPIASGEYLKAEYKMKRDMVDHALAVLAAYEKNQEALYGLAKEKLQKAVADKSLASDKVGCWLRRIFEGNATHRQIETFLRGTDGSSLSSLIGRWAMATKGFTAIEHKRKELGTPRSFHFVKLDVFLGWHYDQRTTYVKAAEHTFESFKNTHPLLLDLRREMAMEDWESAVYFVEKAKKADLSDRDKSELTSLEAHLKARMTEDKEPEEEASEEKKENLIVQTKTIMQKEKELPPSEEVRKAKEELRMSLAQLPASQQQLHYEAMKAGVEVFTALNATYYNRIWGWDNHHLDAHKEARLQSTTADETLERLEEGHTDKFENNDAEMTTKAIRTHSKGEDAPQVLHVSSAGQGNYLAILKEQASNHSFKYWTTVIPEGIDVSTHKQMVKTVHPKIKSSLRTLDKHKETFSLTDAPKKEEAPSYAMAA